MLIVKKNNADKVIRNIYYPKSGSDDKTNLFNVEQFVNVDKNSIRILDNGVIQVDSAYNLSRATSMPIESNFGDVFVLEYDYRETSYYDITYTPNFRFVMGYYEDSTFEISARNTNPQISITPEEYNNTGRQATTTLPLNEWCHIRWSSDPTKRLIFMRYDYTYYGAFELRNVTLTRSNNDKKIATVLDNQSRILFRKGG